NRQNYRQVVWPLPAGALLYVGPATTKKLESYGIQTIGQLAETSPDTLRYLLGKMGDVLRRFANGQDTEPVAAFDALLAVKSIGNSSTGYRNLETDEDVKMMFYALAETVATRVREHGFCATTLTITVRDCALNILTRQCKLERPSNLSGDYAAAAMELMQKHYRWERAIRSVGLSVSDFTRDDDGVQMDLLSCQQHRDEQERLERTVDKVRKRFGSAAVQRAVLLQDKQLTGIKREE
ncbi:MAG: DNA polymerase IV, partial [Angelakisella sp.]